MADPLVMNQIIWFSVRGEGTRMPAVARLAVVDAMREAAREMGEDEEEEDERRPARTHLARRRDD
jgi:hypothetical protein